MEENMSSVWNDATNILTQEEVEEVVKAEIVKQRIPVTEDTISEEPVVVISDAVVKHDISHYDVKSVNTEKDMFINDSVIGNSTISLDFKENSPQIPVKL